MPAPPPAECPGELPVFASRSGLIIRAATTATGGGLDAFYAGYDEAFVLPNEKESYAGFVTCLALNEGDAYRTLAARYGGFREYVLTADDPDGTPRIGGANFIAFPLSPPSGAPLLSINLNYVFVSPSARKRGYLRRLVEDLPGLALHLMSLTNPTDIPAGWVDASGRLSAPALVFIEQNDPYRMTAEAYAADTRFTGLDQISRIGIWARLGAKIVDFPYVQPPLTAQQEADDSLVYGVLGHARDSLDACLLRGHLQRFFAISVLKGSDPATEPSAGAQLDRLAALCTAGATIPLLSAQDLRGAPNPGARAAGLNLRDVLRRQRPAL